MDCLGEDPVIVPKTVLVVAEVAAAVALVVFFCVCVCVLLSGIKQLSGD